MSKIYTKEIDKCARYFCPNFWSGTLISRCQANHGKDIKEMGEIIDGFPEKCPLNPPLGNSR